MAKFCLIVTKIVDSRRLSWKEKTGKIPRWGMSKEYLTNCSI